MNMKTFPALVALLLTLAAHCRAAQLGDLLLTLRNPTPESQEYFGWSVAGFKDNNRIVVGAYGDNTGEGNSGAIYLFDGKTGALDQAILNPSISFNDSFGWSLAAYGDHILTGTWSDNTGASDAGSAYVYDAPSGDLDLIIPNPNPMMADFFGTSVAPVGDRFAVGAPQVSGAFERSGAVYVFREDGRLFRQISNPYPEADALFGWRMVAVKNGLAVSAHATSKGELAQAGAVHIFDRSTAKRKKTIQNPYAGAGDWFGLGLAYGGDRILITAPRSDLDGEDAGVAYIYDKNGKKIKTIHHPEPGAGDWFGWTAASIGDKFVIGAPYADADGAVDSGAIYAYDRNGKLLAKIHNPETHPGAAFGISISRTRDDILVGAYLDTTDAYQDGTAYVIKGF